jgi:hypothetical protein
VSLPTSEPSTTFSPTISPEAHTTNTRVGDHLQTEVLSWRVTPFIGYATVIDHQVLVRTRSKGTRFANISLWFSKGALVMLSRNLVRFVVLFLGRSGSSNLIEALASHPEIIAKGELLAKKDEEGQLQAVRRFLTRPRAAGYAAAGFKTKLRDVRDPEQFAELLREAGAPVILLRRRNVVKQTVSRFNAQRLHDTTKYWNLYDEDNRLLPATIDPPWFSETLLRLEQEKLELEDYVKNLKLPTLSLFYEDLLVSHQTSLERIFSFLGVRYEPVEGQSIKNTSDDLRQAISNFGELRSYYIGTSYEQMFDEVLVSEQGF